MRSEDCSRGRCVEWAMRDADGVGADVDGGASLLAIMGRTIVEYAASWR